MSTSLWNDELADPRCLQFEGGHAVDDSIEIHAMAFIHNQMPHTRRKAVSWLNNGNGGEGSTMHHTRVVLLSERKSVGG